MLELDHVRKRLGGTVAVDDVSLEVQGGERVVLMGPNGAGKSTLLKLVAGVLAPDRGTIRWDGKPLKGPLRRAVGYVPEAADPPRHLSIAELLHLVAATKACAPLDAAIVKQLDLHLLLGASISELSLGQRRRACLAASLVGDPRLLILDEPTNGLDAETMDVLAALLTSDAQRTVLLATHDDAFAERVGTRRVTMRAGAPQGGPADGVRGRGYVLGS